MIQPANIATLDLQLPMNKKLILILCEPRTGSNLLCEAIESYTDLQCINEFFLSPNVGLYVDKDHVPDDLPHKDLLTDEQQDHLFNFLNVKNRNYFDMLVNIYKSPVDSLLELYNITDKTLVVKVMHNHFDELPDLYKLLELSFVELIVLERSNKLEEYVSHRKAIAHNTWYNSDTSNIKIVIDVNKFLEKKEWSFSWYNHIISIISTKNYLELNYEKDLDKFDQHQFCNMFDSWLSSIEVSIDKTNHIVKYFKKQNNAPIEQSILNYDEIKHLVNKSN